MIKQLKCWLLGHNIEKEFFRVPVYEFWKKHEKGYQVSDQESDQNEIEWWCHRCYEYIKK